MAILTDEEMAALEAKEPKKPTMSDEEMADYEALLGQPQSRPEVMKSRRERVAEYLTSRPQAIADTGKALVTPGGGVAASFANGRFAGVVPYLSAGVSTAGDVLRAAAGNPTEIDSLSGVGDAYNRNLARIKPLYDEAEAKEPGANVLGALSFPNPLGNASRLARMGGAGMQAGLQSATHGGNPLEGAGLGAGVQGAAEVVSPLAKYLGGGMRTLAGRSAANAAGFRGGIVNQAKRAGISTIDDLGEEAIPKIGNDMLDAGLIPFMGSKLAVQRRAEAMMKQAANAKNASLVRGDMAGAFPQEQGVKLASERLGARIDPSKGGNLQTARASGPARAFITDAANTPDTFSAADKLKTGAYGSTSYATKAPDAQKLKRQTVSGYRQSIEDELNRVLPGEGDALKKANDRYALAAQTADFAEEAAGREAANQKFGASQLALGALGFSGGAQAGGMLGGGIGGIALPAAAHFAKTRGAATVAPLSHLGSRAANAFGGAVNQQEPLAALAGNALEDFLRPKDDEERQEEGADWFGRAHEGQKGRQ